MSRGSNRSATAPAGTSATEALENAIEESRREYDKKVETMEEIDDKAMRSVRTAVILVGLVVSALSMSGPSTVGEMSVLSILVGSFGVGALAISIVYGIGVYSATEYPTGIGSTHRTDVITGGYSYDEWSVNMLDEYGEWSSKLTEEISKNLHHLELVQFLLSFGVIALLVSASMIVLKTAYGIKPLITFVLVLVFIAIVQAYLGNTD